MPEPAPWQKDGIDPRRPKNDGEEKGHTSGPRMRRKKKKKFSSKTQNGGQAPCTEKNKELMERRTRMTPTPRRSQT